MLLDLEKEVLIASGIRKNDQIAAYKEKLHFLHEQFASMTALSHDPLVKAKQLFQWLWKVKPSRYKSNGTYKLYEIIDFQLSNEHKARGNCLGLTLLYNCLVRRTGLKPEALYLEEAFGIGPHVLTLLRTENYTIDIENIFAEGFDYKGHINAPSRTVWGDKELIADIYNSRGNECFEAGDFPGALKAYKRALQVTPQYHRAQFNLLILRDKMKMEKFGPNFDGGI